MEPGYLIILLVLFILWVFQFAQLMTLGDEVFPGRYDKALWVAAFVVAFPAAPFAFLWWKQIMVALKAEEKK